MERQKMKHRRQLGLRQGMLGIILLCWVLPVVLIVTLGGVYILDSMTRQYRSDMMRSAQSAAAITGRNLDSMIAASRKASYIATMGNAWASYTKTGDYVTFYNEMQTFLTQQYRYDDKFRNTIVTLVDDPAAPIYTSNTSYTSIRKYQQHVRDEVLVRSEALGTGIGFFAADGSLYFNGRIGKQTNHSGGILGGISDGSDIVMRAAFKPTPSIGQPQRTVNQKGEETVVEIKGRHDPIIVPRAVVVVEAMAALTAADMLLLSMTSRLDRVQAFFAQDRV